MKECPLKVEEMHGGLNARDFTGAVKHIEFCLEMSALSEGLAHCL
jgi:hypothetical protein